MDSRPSLETRIKSACLLLQHFLHQQLNLRVIHIGRPFGKLSTEKERKITTAFNFMCFCNENQGLSARSIAALAG